MKRAIDGELLKGVIQYWIDTYSELVDLDTCKIVQSTIDIMPTITTDDHFRDVTNMPTLTQPNIPLTLDELREMDGEPVWGKSLITDKPGEWFIVRVVEMSKAWFIACAGATQGFGDKDTYGTTWLAYRRPVEGEEALKDGSTSD